MAFRKFLIPALEDDSVVIPPIESKESIIDPEAVAAEVVDPAVSHPEEAPPEPAPTPEDAPAATPAPAADAPAADPAADVNTPAPIGDEPAPAETPPVEATGEEAPTSDPAVPTESAQPPAGEAPVETPADDATPAPVVEAPAADAAAGATDEGATAPESAAEAVQAPADTGDGVNAPASTEGGEGTPAAEPEVTPAPAEAPVETTAPAGDEGELSPTDEELSLEEMDAQVALAEEIQCEGDMLNDMSDIRADDVVEDQLYAVLESLEVLGENAAELLENGNYTEQTAQILEDASKAALGQVGVDLQFPAMESYGNDLEIRHKMVMESLDTYAERIRQSLDINLQEMADQYAERYSGYKEIVAKIKRDINGLRAQYNKKKGDFTEKQHEGSLTAVGRFFNVKTGEILPILADDIKISQYILGKYPAEISKNIDTLNSILQTTTYKSPEEFGKFLEKVGTIKPQAEIFKESANGKMLALLGNYGIVREVGGMPKTLKFDAISFPALAEAARFDAYTMHQGTDVLAMMKSGNVQNGSQVIGKIIIGSIAAVYDIVTAQKVVLTTEEIGKLIEAAEDYADNCTDWIASVNKILSTYEKLRVGMKKFSSIGSDIEKVSMTQRFRAWRLLGQVKRVVRNQLRYMDEPTGKESYRAATGARNCFYLARRFVATAK